MLHRITRILRLTQFIALLLVLGMGGVLYGFFVEFEKASRWVEHTHELIDEIEQVRLNALRAGTWLRSYGVYPSTGYLERVRSSAARSVQAAHRVRELTLDSQPERARAQAVFAALSQVLDIYLASADIAQQLGPSALKEMTAAQVSRDITKELRVQLDELEDIERDLLKARSATEQQRLAGFKQVLALAGVLFTSAMLWSIRYSGQILRLSEKQVIQLQTNATRDPLTGLLNRRGLEEFLAGPTDEFSEDGGEHVAVLAFDLDDFKPVNDRHGHAAGDQVLMEVARRLQEQCRGDDAVARVGGDEFVVVLRRVVSRQEAISIAKRIRSRITQPISLAAAEVRVDASIGISMLHEDESDVGALLKAADKHMYLAKRAGKGQVHTDDPAVA
jgi:diguanylate cyclase (GGDEF)-like protein